MSAERKAPEPLSACEEPLASRYDVALLDLDGVVYVGPDPVPDAPENLRKAAKEGMRIGYITNNASRPARVVAEHLASFGLDVIADDVVTSAQAAAKLIASEYPKGSPVLVVGGEGLYVALEEYGLTPVRSSDANPVAVVQGFHPDVNWVMLADGAHAIHEGAKWFATNLDLTIPTAAGKAPGNGGRWVPGIEDDPMTGGEQSCVGLRRLPCAGRVEGTSEDGVERVGQRIHPSRRPVDGCTVEQLRRFVDAPRESTVGRARDDPARRHHDLVRVRGVHAGDLGDVAIGRGEREGHRGPRPAVVGAAKQLGELHRPCYRAREPWPGGNPVRPGMPGPMSASVGRHERVEAFLLRAGHHPSADRRVRGDGKAAVSRAERGPGGRNRR